MYKRILVPVDGSPTSTLGLQEAIRVARDQQARLRLVNVADESILTQNVEGLVNAGEVIDAVRDSGKVAVEKALALVKEQQLDAETATVETVAEAVSDVILREARNWRADLIVMGTHGRRGFNRAMLGSDAEAVLRSSPVPVLTVRSPERP
jgi:nucleotide-binding universal stress UspA family protein